MKTVCITGASSGIGEALAKAFAERGDRLILVARRREKLTSLAEALDTDCEILPCDLAEQAACEALGETLAEKQIDVLVNNAGFGSVGALETADPDWEAAMVDVNLRAVIALTRAVLPMMTARGSGQILNVASVGGILPGGPYMATYYATKAGVVSFTGAVAEELRGQKSPVKIQALCPGPVNTAFNATAGVSSPLSGMSPEACARAALRGMATSKLIIVPGALTALGMALSHLVPRRVLLAVVGHTQRKKLR